MNEPVVRVQRAYEILSTNELSMTESALSERLLIARRSSSLGIAVGCFRRVPTRHSGWRQMQTRSAAPSHWRCPGVRRHSGSMSAVSGASRRVTRDDDRCRRVVQHLVTDAALEFGVTRDRCRLFPARPDALLGMPTDADGARSVVQHVVANAALKRSSDTTESSRAYHNQLGVLFLRCAHD